MIGFYSPAIFVTYLNVVSAIAGMFFAVNGSVTYAMICLIVSGVCDMFDGTIAKGRDRNEQEKSYGIQIDSLADIVAFGLFPAVIGYALGLNQWYHLPIHALIILAALTRLSYFNVKEIERQKQSNESRKYYEGLPVTSVAIILPCIYSLSLLFWLPLTIIYGALEIIIAAAFVSKLKIPKIQMRGLIIMLIISIPTIIFLFTMG